MCRPRWGLEPSYAQQSSLHFFSPVEKQEQAAARSHNPNIVSGVIIYRQNFRNKHAPRFNFNSLFIFTLCFQSQKTPPYTHTTAPDITDSADSRTLVNWSENTTRTQACHPSIRARPIVTTKATDRLAYHPSVGAQEQSTAAAMPPSHEQTSAIY